MLRKSFVYAEILFIYFIIDFFLSGVAHCSVCVFPQVLKEKVKSIRASVGEVYLRYSEIVTWSDLNVISDGFSQLAGEVQSLERIEQTFKHPLSGEGSALSNRVSDMKAVVCSKAQKFEQWLHSYHIGN